MIISLVHPDNVLEIWERAERILDRCETDKMDAKDFLPAILHGHAQLWIAENGEIIAAAITRISEFPKCRVLQIVALAGDNMREWVNGFDQMIEFARQYGCAKIEATGRPGWERVFPGFKRARVRLDMTV